MYRVSKKEIQRSLTILLLILLDQLLKIVVVNGMSVKYYINRGVAFSIWPSTLWWYLIPMVIVSLIAILTKTSSWGLALIIGGGIANLVDRLKYGGVIDFIKLNHWPVFNLADIMIVSGLCIILWNLHRHRK